MAQPSPKGSVSPMQRVAAIMMDVDSGTNVLCARNHIQLQHAISNEKTLKIGVQNREISAPINNNNPAKISQDLITPVQIDKLKIYIDGYKYAKYIIDGFVNGFTLGFESPIDLKNAENARDIYDNEKLVQAKLQEELDARRIEGPFAFPPLNNLQCSPLFLIPKKGGDFRLIHNLSAPHGHSVNDGIPRHNSTVQYQNLSHALNMVKKLGRGCLLAKTDIECAFRIIPIKKSDHYLLGFKWKNNFFFDKCLVMGASSSCLIFEKFSSALHYAMNKFGYNDTVHVLDDFLFAGAPNSNACKAALDTFTNLCKYTGIPLKSQKTVEPCTTLEFLGTTIDTLAMEARLPSDKLEKLSNMLRKFLHKEKATLKEIQSLIGLLNFACFVVVPGRAFLRRIIDLTIGLKKPHHHRRLNLEAKDDIKVWLFFLDSFNGRCIILEDRWTTSASLSLYTDASNIGFGCIFGKNWCFGSWPHSWESKHITIKELFPIVLALELWGEHIKNQCIILYSDNEAVVTMINKMTTKNPDCMALIRRLVRTTMSQNILIHSRHVRGIHNNLADNLSRLQIQTFLRDFPSARHIPTAIPSHLLPT